MRGHVLGTVIAAALVMAAPARAEVHVTIANGSVSVSARDATIRQILTEWARVGQTRIVNVERLAGVPLTLELTNVPESQALDTLLRSVAGYLAAPRADAAANTSRYDRIYILANSTGTPARAVSAPPNAGPTFAPPVFAPPDDQPDDEPPQRGAGPPPPQAPNGPVRGPAFNTFPQPQPAQREDLAQPPAAPQSFTAPTAPVGVSTPGMVVPAPPQPGQPQGRGGNVR